MGLVADVCWYFEGGLGIDAIVTRDFGGGAQGGVV
jgi:hypothetical protein